MGREQRAERIRLRLYDRYRQANDHQSLRSQYNPLHWLSLLLNYRVFDMSSDIAYRAGEYLSKYFSVDHQGCDCITGYRADDRLFMFSQEFIDGRMSYQSFRDALAGDSSNRQFVLKSNRAFDRVSFAGYSHASAEESFPARRSRELRAIKSMRKTADGLFITDLIEQEVRPYDPRL